MAFHRQYLPRARALQLRLAQRAMREWSVCQYVFGDQQSPMNVYVQVAGYGSENEGQHSFARTEAEYEAQNGAALTDAHAPSLTRSHSRRPVRIFIPWNSDVAAGY